MTADRYGGWFAPVRLVSRAELERLYPPKEEAMGEVADMVLEGLLDEQTGEYIGDANRQHYGLEAPGFPVTYTTDHPPLFDGEKIACPHCGKRVKPRGLGDHLIVKHRYHAGDKVHCPQCPRKAKVDGLWQHMRDKHEEAQ